MLFLDSLYRDAAGKAGITYVDVWDGFVDEAGRFLQQGPDFEGQIRRLRSYDGVYFTKAGARKLAHYVEREITRLLAARSAPIALPTEPATPDANAQPGQPAPRPLAGPILPLVASSVGTDQLLGGPGSRPGRGRCAGGANAGQGRAAGAARRPRRRFCLAAPRGRTRTGQGRNAGRFRFTRRDRSRLPPVGQRARDRGDARATQAEETSANSVRPAGTARVFGGFGNAPRPPQALQPQGPRPPRNVGRAASVPGFFTR